MDAGLQFLILMGVVLKVPVVAAVWLIWHAVRAEPDPAQAAEDEGGGNQRRHFRREPKRPSGPRRGPHAPGALALPCADGDPGLKVLRRRPAPAPVTASRGSH